TKKCIESFIYGVNTPSRWGTQAPFSNITLDWTVPNDLAELPAIVGGKEQDFRYKDCKEEMDMVNKAFIEVMIGGDANGRGFQYPIPTYSITSDFDWSDTENNRLLFEMTSKYGTPYFSNYINSEMEPSDVRSMCCRLRLDLRELRKKSGGFFGSGESTGSVGVVTINLPRIAYQSQSEEEFYHRLDRMMDISARSLKTKRMIITKLLEEGLYPYTKRYLGTFANHFSTIGLIGMNEAALNARWIGMDMTHEK
ncbi:MAG: anaerobic ribonucleoside-triphosphate reductase, partial [Lachnospiraceae bacterium]